jgi:dipeptidyl aminopeptidase/acylaminoacyl peptidase
MSDTKEALERALRKAPQPEGVMDSLIRRRARKDQNRRVAATVLAIIIALVAFASLVQTFEAVRRRPADQPTDIFAHVRGWIGYGDSDGDGIWAVNPERPGPREDQIQLSDRPGEPVAWSADGSALLIMRGWLPDGTPVSRPSFDEPGLSVGLVVLHSDGSETRAVTVDPQSAFLFGASLSPDGSQVVYAMDTTNGGDSPRGGIYVVDAQGGTPRLLRSTSMEPVVVPGWRGEMYWPAFSPDGTKIAYFHGGGDHSHSLRVMNADGTPVRVLFGRNQLPNPAASHMYGLAWSPDGSQLAFDADGPGARGIWLIGDDGSRLMRVIADGMSPSWSPDGSHIAYARRGALYVANSDGTHVRRLIAGVKRHWFWFFGGLTWNPLPLTERSEAESTPTLETTDAKSAPADLESRTVEGGGVAAPLSAILALGGLGVLLLAWRSRWNAKARS